MEFISNIHPSFKLNGQNFNAFDLYEFAKELEKTGEHFEIQIGKFLMQWLDETDSVLVKTSGSSGTPKEIQLSKQQMINSAKATGIFFKLPEKTTALLCLPANYIAGKMMLIRAMVLGWNLHVVAPQKDAITQYDNKYDFVAMVPYQVHHSLKSLDKIRKLIIGGGAISDKLTKELQDVNTEVFATYGMTETITHIAVRRINGLAKSNEYTALPNVKFSLDERACLVIKAPDVSKEKVVTNDMVQLNSPTTFEYLGRIDNVIISGGIKLFPEQMEIKLSPFMNLPFIVASEKDETLGERVVLILESESGDVPLNISEVFQNLSSYERPKKIYTFSKFPITETGKIKRSEVIQILENKK